MLDDGEAQARAAGLAGVAVVDPVEPLEHPRLVLRRDADAGIAHAERDAAGILPHDGLHAAALPIVLDGVVQEVVDHLLQDLLVAQDQEALAGGRKRHIPRLSLWLKPFDHRLGKRQKIHFRLFRDPGFFIQARKPHHVLDQRDEPGGLVVDAGREVAHVLWPGGAVFHDLGVAGDGGQRGFQLVGDVGGELPAAFFRALAVGDVEGQDHRAPRAGARIHGVSDQLVGVIAHFQLRLRALAAAGALHHALKRHRAIDGEDGLSDERPGIDAKDHRRALVDGQDVARARQEHHALAHVLGDGGELAPILGQFLQTLLQLLPLALHAGQKRAKLLVHVVFQRLV